MSTVTQTITPELRTWIVEQARNGCQPEAVLASMKTSGWQEDVAIKAMEQALQGYLATAQPAAAASAHPALEPFVAHAVPDPLPDPAVNTLWAGDRHVKVLLHLRLPRVVVFGGLLSDEECDALRAEANPRLSRSQTVVNDTGASEVNEVRTSDGMFFGRGESPLCKTIEARLSVLAGWPVENGEGLQILRYGPGAEYKPHYDYFDPAHAGTPTILRRGGQRVGTFVMYLNTPEQGGGTTFPDVGLEVAPVKGNAVFFSYDRPHPSTRSLHGGSSVLAGEKWVATKWLRQGRFD